MHVFLDVFEKKKVLKH